MPYAKTFAVLVTVRLPAAELLPQQSDVQRMFQHTAHMLGGQALVHTHELRPGCIVSVPASEVSEHLRFSSGCFV